MQARSDPSILMRLHVDIVLVPGFPLSELAAVQEVVESLNHLQESSDFALTLLSLEGGDVEASDARLRVKTESMRFERGNGLAVFTGGASAMSHARVLAAASRHAEHAGRELVVFSEAVCALHAAGRFHDRTVVVPWDDLYVEEAVWPDCVTSELLYIRSGNVITCAGRVSAYDLMVTRMCDLVGRTTPTQITDRLKMADIRTPLARQRKATRHRYRIENATFARVVEIIENTLDDPLPMPELAGMVGMSVRQIERNFNKVFGLSPVKFRRQKQVQKARWLADNSGLSATEIAVACGFGTRAQLAKEFRKYWGMSITQRRLGNPQRVSGDNQIE